MNISDGIGYLRGSLALSQFKNEKYVQEVVLEMNFNLKDFKTFFWNWKYVKKYFRLTNSTLDSQV